MQKSDSKVDHNHSIRKRNIDICDLYPFACYEKIQSPYKSMWYMLVLMSFRSKLIDTTIWQEHVENVSNMWKNCTYYILENYYI